MARHSVNTEQVSEADKAWFAGFFDGEGTILITRHQSRDLYYPLIQIVNTDIRAIQKCYEIWQCGHIATHLIRSSRKPYHLWRTTNKNAVEILRAISPYLAIKKEQGLAVLWFASMHNRFYTRHIPHEQRKQQGIDFNKLLKDIRKGKDISISYQADLL